MVEYEKVLLLRSDGQVDAIKRTIIKTDAAGRRVLSLDESKGVEVTDIASALVDTSVGSNVDSIKKMKALNTENEAFRTKCEDLRSALTTKERQANRLQSAVTLKEDKNSLQRLNSNLMAIEATKEEEDMSLIKTNPDDTEPKTPSLWDSIKEDAVAGLKLGGGIAASQLTAQATTKALAEIGVPAHALEHPLMKVLIQIGAPVAVRGVVGFIPGVKDNKVLGSFLGGAQKAAFASVTEQTLNGAAKVVMPMIGMLTSAANAQKELESEPPP